MIITGNVIHFLFPPLLLEKIHLLRLLSEFSDNFLSRQLVSAFFTIRIFYIFFRAARERSAYISKKLAEELLEQNLKLITTIKKKMKNYPIPFMERILLRKRAVIESVNDILKNHLEVEHSRHRSIVGFMNNILSALVAYSYYPTKPSMRGIDPLPNAHLLAM